MEKGGYKIIDLKDTNITTSSTTIKGVYNAINDNYRKAVLLSGLKINGVLFSDEFVKVVKTGGDFVLHAYDVVADSVLSKYDLYIDSDDNVTLQLKTIDTNTKVELLETITLTEAVQTITRTNLDLRYIFVKIDVPAEYVETAVFKVYDYNENSAYSFSNADTGTGGEKSAIMTVDVSKGVFMVISSPFSRGGLTNFSVYPKTVFASQTNIKKFTLSSSSTFPVGTIARVWGY